MHLKYTVRTTTKAGNQPSEMEDAAWPAGDLEKPLTRFTCAVADGATQGSHSGPWALSLCEEFTLAEERCSAPVLMDQVVPKARARFEAWEKTYLVGRAQSGRALQWFEEAVIGTGAFTTLLGLSLARRQDGTVEFHCVAVGDSCLFVVREEKVFESFPLASSEQFAGAPLLIASHEAHNRQMHEGTFQKEGVLTPGDSLLLCTDALAAWIMREKEQGKNPVAQLSRIFLSSDQKVFEDFIHDLRLSKRIRNDDVTLVHLDFKA